MVWEDIEFDPEQIPAFKLGFHLAQILFAFVAWCLEIAVLRAADSQVNGNNGWTFAVCFLSIPAWIYLAMAPRFPRTRKIAQPHAMVTVDALFAVIWLSAFATQAAYNTANSCGSVCALSKAIVGMAFFVFLFFCVTTFLSIYTLKYYQWNNRLPGYGNKDSKAQNIDPDKAAFSMTPHDEEAYAPVDMNDHDADHDESAYGGAPSHVSDPYASTSVVGSQVSNSSYGAPTENPFRQDNPFDSDTEYHSSGQSIVASGGRYAPPSVNDEYEDDNRPARFPAASYDRIER
ncbi:hypothetical protein QBC46DRAFT_133627 [Diplogelasinospora grovesii]|uniref:MARVEL domain-containing protein n=1 Tax=Diplogelasinospora grovesii TaxID=303347 RepID=A0AAN6NG18_9PEZI|nr:hypothetical protein QBC46DRAFT_133627 [Diplogelasinospora grovesii]